MPLSDTGLVCRYYIDQAASGQGPTQVDDSSANAYHLTEVNYGSTNLNWTEVSGNRGLESTATTGAQRARRSIDNTSDAFRDAMDGIQKFTLEVVVSVDALNASTSRIFAANRRDGSFPRVGMIGTAVNTSSGARFAFNAGSGGANGGSAFFTLASAERRCWHYVVDTTIATPSSDRQIIYRDGVEFTQDTQNIVDQNVTLSLVADMDLVLFNRESSGSFDRSFDGRLFYAAAYNVAFDATRASDHSTILLSDDDAPAAGATSLIVPSLRGYSHLLVR